MLEYLHENKNHSLADKIMKQSRREKQIKTGFDISSWTSPLLWFFFLSLLFPHIKQMAQ